MARLARRYDWAVSPSAAHDPVFALAESDATGRTAEVFADIRAAMAIPLVTSIWRVLAGLNGALQATWALAAPVVRTGQSDAALVRLRAEMSWPRPAVPLGDDVWKRDMAQIRALVAAYTRGNALTLLTLSALVTEATGKPATLPVPLGPGRWPSLPPLPPRDAIGADTWVLVERVNRIGATADQPGVATLWRHLSAWPSLLRAIDAALAPLQSDGTYAAALAATEAVVADEAHRLAHLRPGDTTLPDDARALVLPYVTHPGLVQRMVVIGHIVARWLDDGEASR